MPGNQCAADPWKWFHLGPISRDWARCELCGEYLDRIYETDYPDGSWRYIRHALVAALDAEEAQG